MYFKTCKTKVGYNQQDKVKKKPGTAGGRVLPRVLVYVCGCVWRVRMHSCPKEETRRTLNYSCTPVCPCFVKL